MKTSVNGEFKVKITMKASLSGQKQMKRQKNNEYKVEWLRASLKAKEQYKLKGNRIIQV